MNIAIIAQNRKKELAVQFCIAYCGILSQHDLCATGTTGKLITEATGLKVDCLLPGVSGGVMCVLFGIYQPMMALLSHPGKAFRQYYRLFIPVLIGCAIGFVGLSKVVELAFGADSAIVTCLFFHRLMGKLPRVCYDDRAVCQ